VSSPATKSEYLDRFAKNQRLEGYGLDTTTYMPCPFCAAADFMVPKLLETEAVLMNGATCRECGRSAKAVFTRGGGGASFEIVQTGGLS